MSGITVGQAVDIVHEACESAAVEPFMISVQFHTLRGTVEEIVVHAVGTTLPHADGRAVFAVLGVTEPLIKLTAPGNNFSYLLATVDRIGTQLRIVVAVESVAQLDAGESPRGELEQSLEAAR